MVVESTKKKKKNQSRPNPLNASFPSPPWTAHYSRPWDTPLNNGAGIILYTVRNIIGKRTRPDCCITYNIIRRQYWRTRTTRTRTHAHVYYIIYMYIRRKKFNRLDFPTASRKRDALFFFFIIIIFYYYYYYLFTSIVLSFNHSIPPHTRMNTRDPVVSGDERYRCTCVCVC